MKLWLLLPRDGLDEKAYNRNWDYDAHHGFVIRAETENEARKIAHDESSMDSNSDNVWIMPELTTCVELRGAGEPGVVLERYLNG